MITSLSKYITHFFIDKQIVDEKESEIYQYGFEMIISTFVGFLITFSIGILIGMSIYSLVYYLIFVILRLFAGGYHADSYLKCNTVFGVVTIFTLSLSEIFFINTYYSIFITLLISLFAICTMLIYAPVENEHKVMSNKVKCTNRRISIYATIALVIFSVLIFNKYRQLSVIITMSLFSISLLIIIETIRRKEGISNE